MSAVDEALDRLRDRRDAVEDDDELDEDDEDGQPWSPPFWGEDGRVRVMRENCSTCIFRAGNPMQLNPGRVRSMTDETDRTDSNVICHKTLGTKVGALCAGSVERRPGQLVRISERLGLVLVDEKEYAS